MIWQNNCTWPPKFHYIEHTATVAYSVANTIFIWVKVKTNIINQFNFLLFWFGCLAVFEFVINDGAMISLYSAHNYTIYVCISFNFMLSTMLIGIQVKQWLNWTNIYTIWYPIVVSLDQSLSKFQTIFYSHHKIAENKTILWITSKRHWTSINCTIIPFNLSMWHRIINDSMS